MAAAVRRANELPNEVSCLMFDDIKYVLPEEFNTEVGGWVAT